MKFILTMYICSAIAQQCGAPIVKTTEYNDFNDCLQNGYSKSQLILANYTAEQINQYQMLIKFTCIEQQSKGA